MSETAFDFAGLKFQEHLNVFLVVFKYMNTLRTLQIILKIILSAFQIVKELCFSFENHFLRIFTDKNRTTGKTCVVWNPFPKILKEWWAIPGSNQ